MHAGWDLGVIACKRDGDCQTPFVTESLKCENSVQFHPLAATNSTWLHVWQPEGSARANVSISVSLTSNRAKLMAKFGVYNQTQFAPVCNSTPHLVSHAGGDTVQLRGVNMAGMEKDLWALGPMFETNGVQGTTHPSRNAYRTQLSCVFAQPGTWAQCITKDGDTIPGTPCTTDKDCLAAAIDTDTGVTQGLHPVPLSMHAMVD